MLSDAPTHDLGPRTYNALTSTEIGGIVLGTPGVDAPRIVTVQSRAEPLPNHLKFVRSKEDYYDALSYTLLHMK